MYLYYYSPYVTSKIWELIIYREPLIYWSISAVILPSVLQAISYPHRGTRVEGTEGRWRLEPLPWVFVLLRLSEINLHPVENPRACSTRWPHFWYIQWCHLTWTEWRIWIRHLRSLILDFTIFLKSQKITEFNTKSNQNGKKIENKVNKLIFFQTYVKFAAAMTTSKIVSTQFTYQSVP